MDNISIKTYAGVLGKIFGVYSGRPVETWYSYDKIMNAYGELWGYPKNSYDINNNPVLTDDDITGTFVFIRAIEDNGYKKYITSKEIGQAWMNYIVENKAILWWGGYGMSTEHTAYINMRNGILPPDSGSIETNGKIVAEQIGAQIFIDAWGMIAADDPEYAAYLAEQASYVSHDGEAMYAAKIIAVAISLSYSMDDMKEIIKKSMEYIPNDSIIYKIINQLLEMRENENNWHKVRSWIENNYGYDKYLGNCHVVPNHALVIMALLWCDDSFDKAMMISNTSGWDTDCNAANVGAILGVKNGLASFEENINWRDIVSDQIFLPTADGGSSLSDAVKVSDYIMKLRSKVYNIDYDIKKNNAYFHFEYPGSTQSFRQESAPFDCYAIDISNSKGHSLDGENTLKITTILPLLEKTNEVYVSTATFIPEEKKGHNHYEFLASPSIYSGQVVKTKVIADKDNTEDLSVSLYLLAYDENDNSIKMESKSINISAKEVSIIEWEIPQTNSMPIFKIGYKIETKGIQSLHIDYLTWEKNPNTTIKNIGINSALSVQSWISTCDNFANYRSDIKIIKNSGETGLLFQGTNNLSLYTLEASLSVYCAESVGIAGYIKGLNRYYAFIISKDNKCSLILNNNDERTILESSNLNTNATTYHQVKIEFKNEQIVCSVDSKKIIEYNNKPIYEGGAFGFCVSKGTGSFNYLKIY